LVAKGIGKKMKLKETLNLPKTTFPMKLDKSVEVELRDDVLNPTQRGTFTFDAKRCLLHDGPPFANGDIHLGHAINKVVKDITNRLFGRETLFMPFRPGWDCHGLPIENLVREAGGDVSNVPEFRTKCEEHARKWIDAQKESFKRLGVAAIWADPYITMSPNYEATTLRVFGEVFANGLVYRKKKPVHWSIENQTALAVGELEYEKVKATSAYVGFSLWDTYASEVKWQLLVWTTTPWTLPANDCIAVNPNADYVRVRVEKESDKQKVAGGAGIYEVDYILCAERAKILFPNAPIKATYKGSELVGQTYQPPFLPDGVKKRVYAADFVSTETEDVVPEVRQAPVTERRPAALVVAVTAAATLHVTPPRRLVLWINLV
jgi:isoleucyl-tRNA synthetase